MNTENEDIKLFYEKLDRFIELADNIHSYSYVLENPRGRGEDILLLAYNELKKEEQEEQELAKDICYSLYRIVYSKYYQILFKPREENITNDRE